jgi:DNA-binding response OmpR family regulator
LQIDEERHEVIAELEGGTQSLELTLTEYKLLSCNLRACQVAFSVERNCLLIACQKAMHWNVRLTATLANSGKSWN